MEVFIEYAIIDNLIMDFLLLKATAKLTKTKQDVFLIVLGSIVGCIVAVVVPIFNVNDGLYFLIRIILAGLICLISAKHKTLLGYFKFLNVFVFLTFAVGGTVIGVLSLMGIDYSTANLTKNGVLPVGVNFAVAYVVYLIIRKAMDKTFKKVGNKFVCDCEIILGEKSIAFKGYIDSGNLLTDAKTGLPIVVCSRGVVNKIFGNKKLKNRFYPITTASGFGMIELFEIDGIKIYFGKEKVYADAILGVSESSSKLVQNADLIIGASLV